MKRRRRNRGVKSEMGMKEKIYNTDKQEKRKEGKRENI